MLTRSDRVSWWFKRVLLATVAAAVTLIAAELLVGWLVPLRNVGPSWSVYDPVYLQVLKKNFHCRRWSPEFTEGDLEMAVKVPIFMDNNSTTPVDPRVLDAMLPFFKEDFGNAATIFKDGFT